MQVVQARMIGTNEQGVPMVHLYRAVAGQTTMVNRWEQYCAVIGAELDNTDP